MNVELALDALQDAREHPENFSMDSWQTWGVQDFTKGSEAPVCPPCGTTGCYAAFVSLRAAPVGTAVEGSYVFPPGADRKTCGIHVDRYATEKLGLRQDQAASLFFLNNLREVEAAVKYLADSPDATGDTIWSKFYNESDDAFIEDGMVPDDADFEPAS